MAFLMIYLFKGEATVTGQMNFCDVPAFETSVFVGLILTPLFTFD